jgi:ABC-type transport system involved in multi-copper enzyme maturation permease subunit
VNLRLRAALIIARRQAFETLLSPGFYVTMAVGLVLGCFLVTGFSSAVDTAGLNTSQNPLYDLLDRSLTGTFGPAFAAKLFAEGPFLIALVLSFLPVFLFLSITAVIRFGQERSSGAVELLTYGPADGTSYVLGTFFTQAVFAGGALLVILGFLWISALIGNLAPGPLFILAVPLLFLVSLPIFAYGCVCSISSSSTSSALASFLGLVVFFLVVLAASLSISSASVRSVASVAASVIQWISPFYYGSLAIQEAQVGRAVGIVGAMLVLPVLSGVLLAVCHAAISRRGVRA